MKRIVLALSFLVASSGCGGSSGGSGGSFVSQEAQVNLSSYYNQSGFFPDGSTYSQSLGFDLNGWSFSSTELGTQLAYDGFNFTLGSASTDDVISCSANSQTISLPSGNYSKLLVLASAIGFGASQVTLEVDYTDSTSTSFTQNFSDWVNTTTEVGQTVVKATTHRNFYDGTADTNPAYVYGYSFSLDKGKTASTLKLPISQVRILAIAVIP